MTLREKCPKRSDFWSVFSCIRTEYGKIQTEITPYFDTFHIVWSLCTVLKDLL